MPGFFVTRNPGGQATRGSPRCEPQEVVKCALQIMLIEKAALALLEKAQDCFDLAETQQDNADKQHENAARQHASADKESDNAAKLVTLACALVDDAVNLQGETEVLPAPLHQRGPRSPPAP
jgi:hypothetical protein